MQVNRTQPAWLAVAAIVLIAIILRGPLVAVAPIAGMLRADLQISAAQVGLLTSLPVLCFGLVTPLASFFIGKAGANLATTTAILGVGIGSIVRSSGGIEATVAGTLIMGAFITIGNVVIPVIIRRDISPGRVGIVTGTYTAGLNIGSMTTTLATAPLADAFGWRAALLAWVGFVIIAAVGWILAMGIRPAFHWGPLKPAIETNTIDVVTGDSQTHSPLAAPTSPRTWRSATAILLAIAFAGQGFSYYGLTAWFPAILEADLGFNPGEAGSSASVFQVAAIIGALGIPLLASRVGEPVALLVLFALWISCPLIILLAPHAWLASTALGGIAQGGGITIIFVLIVKLSSSGTHARGLSSMIQGFGYVIAAIAPAALGAMHDATGDWNIPLIAVCVSTLVFGTAGVAAALRVTRGARAAT